MEKAARHELMVVLGYNTKNLPATTDEQIRRQKIAPDIARGKGDRYLVNGIPPWRLVSKQRAGMMPQKTVALITQCIFCL